VLGRPFWATPWWRGSTNVQARIRAAAARAAAGGAFRERLPYWTADGTERVVDFAMHPIRDSLGQVRFLHPTGIDVTERTRAEAALRAREAAEREIAVGLQRALLPDRLALPERVSWAARYEAGSGVLEVGGDWYDAFALADGRVAVTVGDVVGHGLRAGAAMGQLRTAIVALAEDVASPGELLARLEGFLARTRTTDFATVCFGLLDPETGVFEYASAGHPPMLLVLPSGDVRWLDDAKSPPLRGGERRARPQASVVLEEGSLLVLYTDGLIERRGELLAEGLDRLARAAVDERAAPIDSVCDRLVAALGVDSTRADDVAVLAIRLEPACAAVFRRAFDARPAELRGLRSAMRAWLAEQHVAGQTADALLLTVGEACSNAIEHAYLGREPGEVAIEVDLRADRAFEVSIRDDGRFRPPSQLAGRGRGTVIMRELTTGFSRESTLAGTTVRFRLPVVDAAPSR
jgi:anti-sigma regulatory factor (Ser/Thr protein kinase)